MVENAEQASPRGGRGQAVSLVISLPRLAGKQSVSAALFLASARDNKELVEIQGHLEDPLGLLARTAAAWRTWRERAKAPPADGQVGDLIDGILCLMKSHVGFDGLHTGSLRYPHDRAWIRDNYWVARAFLEAGYVEEAKVNLDAFLRFWQKSGVCSYYDYRTDRGTHYGYDRVELAHYLVLMVRDAERLGGIDPKPYYPMVKGALEYAKAPLNGLQPMNGDETWLLTTPVNELDYLLDNSWLLIASAEYGADLAKRMGDAPNAESWGRLARRAREAVEEKLFDPRLGYFGMSVSADERRDMRPCAGVLARGILLGVYPPTDPRMRKGLERAWQCLQGPEGIRSTPDSSLLDGGTPGYFLWAASEAGLPLAGEVAPGLLRLCATTGNVWEMHSIYDPKFSGEKRRLWDSAVVAAGLLGFARSGLEAAPAPPAKDSDTCGRPLLKEAVTYPQASVDIAARFGVPLKPPLSVTFRSGGEGAALFLREFPGSVSQQLGKASASLQVSPAEKNVLRIEGAVQAGAAGPPGEIVIQVALPAQARVIAARDFSGRWDRIEDPVELTQSNAGAELAFRLHPGPGEKRSVSVTVAVLPPGA